MDLIELVEKGSGQVVAHACGKCRCVRGSRDAAEACCEPPKCGTCGEIIGQFYCGPCIEKRLREEEARRFEKATKINVADYDDPLYVDGIGEGDYGDGYFSDIDVLEEHCADREAGMPTYAWACSESGYAFDADRLVDDALEEFYDGAKDQLSAGAVEELQTFLDGWRDRNPISGWMVDYSRAVLLTDRGAATEGSTGACHE